MKYCSFLVCPMMRGQNPRFRSFLLVTCFLALVVQPAVSTFAGITEDSGDLFLSCRADNDCVLTPTPIGEEQVSGQTFANIVQPEVITFEFEMDPGQLHVALLPEVLKEFQLDFKHQTEAGSLFRPALELRMVFGQNVNEWSFEASTLPDLATSNYELTNEALTFSDGRVLWEDDPIRLIFSVTLDRPGTWSLNMRGASFLKLEIGRAHV